MNSKIVITIFFSFALSLTTLYLMDEMADAVSYGNTQFSTIDLEKIDPNELRIVILGSSRVSMLDAVYIDNYVLEKGYDVDVYNGAIAAATPKKIISNVDDWISKKPDVVFLPVEMHQLIPAQNKDGKIQRVVSDCSAKISTLPQMIENLIPLEREFMGLDFSNFDNPKLTTLTILSNAFSEQDSLEQSDYTEQNEIKNKQAWNFEEERVQKIASEDEIIENRDTGEMPKRFSYSIDSNGKQVKALGQIIERFQEEKIKVVIFTVPIHRTLLEISPSCSIDEFEQLVEKLSHDYNIESFYYHEKYSDLPIWRDKNHITHAKEGKIYTEDFAKMIVDVIGN